MNQCRIDLNQDNMIATFASPQFYGDTEVYIRELLQNALDACNTRAAFEWSWGTEFLEMEEARALNSMREPFHAKIRITYSSLNQRLTIEDNGIGMNGGDIEKYVSKIGQSYYKSEDFVIQHAFADAADQCLHRQLHRIFRFQHECDLRTGFLAVAVHILDCVRALQPLRHHRL